MHLSQEAVSLPLPDHQDYEDGYQQNHSYPLIGLYAHQMSPVSGKSCTSSEKYVMAHHWCTDSRPTP